MLSALQDYCLCIVTVETKRISCASTWNAGQSCWVGTVSAWTVKSLPPHNFRENFQLNGVCELTEVGTPTDFSGQVIAPENIHQSIDYYYSWPGVRLAKLIYHVYTAYTDVKGIPSKIVFYFSGKQVTMQPILHFSWKVSTESSCDILYTGMIKIRMSWIWKTYDRVHDALRKGNSKKVSWRWCVNISESRDRHV